MDLRDVVTEGMSGFEKLVAKIPGYKGYKEKEMRREADKLLRDHIYGVLIEQRRRIEDVQGELGVERAQGGFHAVLRIGLSNRGSVRGCDAVGRPEHGAAEVPHHLRVGQGQLNRLLEGHVPVLGLRIADATRRRSDTRSGWRPCRNGRDSRRT